MINRLKHFFTHATTAKTLFCIAVNLFVTAYYCVPEVWPVSESVCCELGYCGPTPQPVDYIWANVTKAVFSIGLIFLLASYRSWSQVRQTVLWQTGLMLRDVER